MIVTAVLLKQVCYVIIYWNVSFFCSRGFALGIYFYISIFCRVAYFCLQVFKTFYALAAHQTANALLYGLRFEDTFAH